MNEQSGIQAGDGGFQINVVGDTSLIGGVISSTQEAVESGVNQFETGGELHTSDIQNHMQYSAKSISVGTGGAGYGSESASQQSTSQAGISGVAGNAEVRSGDAGSGLANTFDASKVQKELDAHAAITAQFGQQASTAWGDYANQQFLDAVTHGDEQSATCWAPDGSCRAAGHMLVGGATGGLDGALGAGFSSVSAPHVQAFFIKQGLPAEAAAALTELTALGAGALLGDGEGAVAGYNEASNNAVQFMMPAGGPVAAKMCLSSPACVKAVIMVGGAVAVEAMVLLLPEDELGQMQVPGFGEGLSPQETWSTILLMADVYESLRLGLGGKPATNAEDVSGTPGYVVNDEGLGSVTTPIPDSQGLGNVLAEGGEGDFVDLTTPQGRIHILDGDDRGGGHRAGRNVPGKSEFPSDWSDDKVIHVIADIATDPNSRHTNLANGRAIVEGVRDGIEVRVIVGSDGNIVTGYPTNLLRNP